MGSGIGARKDSSVFMLMQLLGEIPPDEDETGDPGSGTGSGTVILPQEPEPVDIESVLSDDESTERLTVSLDSSFDEDTGAALVKVRGNVMEELLRKAKDSFADGRKTVIELKADTDEDTVSMELPSAQFAELAQINDLNMVLNMGTVSLTFDRELIDNIGKQLTGDSLEIKVSKVDNTLLPEEIQLKVGNRPVYDFSIISGDTIISDFHGGSVEISIPYTPALEEKTNSIIVYFIDDNNNLNTVIGRYDEETGRVWFRTTHFSRFAVGYNEVIFVDVAEDAWYSEVVGFMAARDIVRGVGNNKFEPERNVTRADFLIMIMNYFNIQPNYENKDNFDDAGDTYYTPYLATAKALDLVKGTGDNLYRPEDQISRQDMFVILYRLLEYNAGLPEDNEGVSLQEFEDVDEISDYALDEIKSLVEKGIVRGSGSKINPKRFALRSEAIQVLYNLYPGPRKVSR